MEKTTVHIDWLGVHCEACHEKIEGYSIEKEKDKYIPSIKNCPHCGAYITGAHGDIESHLAIPFYAE